jgi:hypothetical protein
MGTIDKIIHNFRCSKCEANEIVTIFEKGSNWEASWTSPPDLDIFSVEWKPNQFGEPCPIKILCKSCGSEGFDE